MVNLSWLSDQISNGVKNVSTFYRNNFSTVADALDQVGLKDNPMRTAADFIDDEITQKSDLRGAETETFLRGLPIVGGVINGIEGVNQLEDLYNRTGKIPAYPGSNSPGAAGIGSAIGQLTRKIEDGSNSLHTFYSGEPEMNMWSDGSKRFGWQRMI